MASETPETRSGVPSQKALQAWADVINEWYELGATVEEVLDAYVVIDGEDFENLDGSVVPYPEAFLKRDDGEWVESPDTADREWLADIIEKHRASVLPPPDGDEEDVADIVLHGLRELGAEELVETLIEAIRIVNDVEDINDVDPKRLEQLVETAKVTVWSARREQRGES